MSTTSETFETFETFEDLQNADRGELVRSEELDGGWTDHLIFDVPDLFSVAHRFDASGKQIDVLFTSPRQAEEMARHQVSLLGDDGARWSCLASNAAKPFLKSGFKTLLKSLREFEEDNGKIRDPESVQTADQARVFNNKRLVEEIQKIYTGLGCKDSGLDKLTVLEKIPVLVKGKEIEIPFLFTTYLCTTGGALLPTETTYVWDFAEERVAKLVKCAYVGVKTEIYKEFMYEYVTKTSTITAGLSLGLTTPGTKVSTGPKKGEPVHDHGAKKTDAAGEPINFDFSWIKTWSRLRIEASLRVKDELGDFKCQEIGL